MGDRPKGMTGDDRTRDRVRPEEDWRPSGEELLRGAAEDRVAGYAVVIEETTVADDDTTASTDAIRAEIEQARAEMGETIDAIQEKLRPANLMSQATETVKTATVERVKDMANTAGQYASDMISDTRDAASGLVEGARANPLPIALIGIGAAWLLMNRTSGKQRRYVQGDRYDTRRSLVNDRDEYGRGDRTFGSQSLANEAGAQVRRATRRAQNGLQRLMQTNPLAVGVAAAVVGAAVGLALPETQTENEWMGDARDTVVERAQNMARSAADQVKDTANQAVDRVIKTE
jgi:hypothetical protein